MSLKAEFKREHRKLGLRKRQRVELGLTRKNIRRVYSELKASGQFSGLTKKQKLARLRGQLRMERPAAMNAQLAIDEAFWDRLWAFLKWILPYLIFLL